MTEKVPCTACGAAILPSTAAKNGGRCMPCATGTRESIEASKRYYQEQNAFLQSSTWAVWTSLVDRVHGTEEGFSGLTHDERLYYAANAMNGDVYNGGFHQYFANHNSSYYLYAVEGLRRVGASHSLNLLQRAKAVVFADGEVPTDVTNRREALRQGDDAGGWAELDGLDSLYYQDPDDIGSRLDDLLCALLPSSAKS